ncbi:hypothetical protein AO070_17170 [Pseudomonas syringae pv. syringae PD2766]|uniref:hypothetical protein n=1 Tax=Pseudomonas syringae TaxID=317 RepID=UPI000736644D|nr:hypothetical protein [Pseudomonas syringae]KTB77301.1 hypothetical protein AO070_17170 [Pseudomonas syringae pv. syringae PD2766]
MLDTKKDFKLIVYIGDSLSQDKHISDPAFLSALPLTAQQHVDVHLVLLACKNDRYFRWAVKDMILYHHKKLSEEYQNYGIVGIIARVFNILCNYNALSPLPPLVDDYPDFMQTINMTMY